jgi:hypothetical protein
MWRHDADRDVADESAARKPEPPPPAPAMMPGTLAWASAIGNQAVARMAAEHEETPEEVEEPEPGAEPEVVPPEDEADEELPA